MQPFNAQPPLARVSHRGGLAQQVRELPAPRPNLDVVLPINGFQVTSALWHPWRPSSEPPTSNAKLRRHLGRVPSAVSRWHYCNSCSRPSRAPDSNAQPAKHCKMRNSTRVESADKLDRVVPAYVTSTLSRRASLTNCCAEWGYTNTCRPTHY